MGAAPTERIDSGVPRRLGGFARRNVWWIVAAVLAGLALGLVAWAGTRPSYDAYGWLVWGYQTVHGSLDLGGAPSWKPLPYLFTVPYALLGRGELGLWMFTAVALSLPGAIFAGRIAYRLTLSPSHARGGASAAEAATPGRRHAAMAAAVFAGVALFGLQDYTHYILSVQSDPLIVTFTLAAIDCHLSGRRRWAFVCALLASLGRPEAWPWLALYALWCWWRVPRMRWMIVAGAGVLVFMWFGIPTITNGRPFVSAQLAFNSPRALKTNKVFGTIGHFLELQYLPIWLAALVCLAIAAVRRNWVVLALGGGALGWLIIEIGFTLHGWAPVPRYMFEAAAVCTVLAGVAVGWILTETPRLRSWMPAWAGIPVVAVLVAALVPGALGRLRTEHRDLKHERVRATQIALLGTAIARLGGARHVMHCGEPGADFQWVSALAYVVDRNIGLLGHRAQHDLHLHRPMVLFFPLKDGGWKIVPSHLHRHSYAACHSLRSYFARTPGHPDGQLVPY